MGNQGSSTSSGGARIGSPTLGRTREEDTCFCGLGNFPEKLRQLVGRDNDPIGTPLPDTPQHERRRREHIKDAFLEQEEDGTNGHHAKGGIFSSKYFGLEKDLGGSSFLLPPAALRTGGGGAGSLSERTMAPVYEGPDSEQRLLTKYDLMEILGVGSTSTVHRCRDRTTGLELACKIIDCPLVEERFHGMMAQFQTEIEALRKLSHPGIIRLYDVFISKTKIYIVMELMEGGELFDYVVQKGTLTEEEASKIVHKVTSALVYMHENNIVHRDLKPENLLLKKCPPPNSNKGDDIDVKIIDFGLSKAMEGPVARTFLGTRGYLAPEMLQRRDYTRAVDSWALGVIVFVLLCGCLPFDDDSSTVPSDDLVKAKFVLRFPRWAKNLSVSAKDLLAHLLDVNPQTRYTAEQALSHPWVRGETALRGSLLSSPGRIRTTASPGSATKKQTAATISQEHARARRQNDLHTGVSPPLPIPRKQSF